MLRDRPQSIMTGPTRTIRQRVRGTLLHWLTVDEAMLLGAWSNRQSVLSAIKRGRLQAENINPDADPRRYEYRTTAEWVLEYVVTHRRIGDGEEAQALADTIKGFIMG